MVIAQKRRIMDHPRNSCFNKIGCSFNENKSCGNMTMQIREATIDDAQRILELGRILHAESYYSDYSLDQSRAKAAINDILAYPKQAK